VNRKRVYNVYRTLKIVDDFTRVCVAIGVDRSLPATSGPVPPRRDDRLTGHSGDGQQPRIQRPRARSSAYVRGVQLRVHSAGEADRERFVESFNRKVRDECLNDHWFASVAEARALIDAWRVDYNTLRPHSALQGATPEQLPTLSLSLSLRALNAGSR